MMNPFLNQNWLASAKRRLILCEHEGECLTLHMKSEDFQLYFSFCAARRTIYDPLFNPSLMEVLIWEDNWDRIQEDLEYLQIYWETEEFFLSIAEGLR